MGNTRSGQKEGELAQAVRRWLARAGDGMGDSEHLIQRCAVGASWPSPIQAARIRQARTAGRRSRFCCGVRGRLLWRFPERGRSDGLAVVATNDSLVSSGTDRVCFFRNIPARI